MRNKKRGIIIILILILLIIGATSSIVYGIYLDKISRPQYIFGTFIDNVSETFKNYFYDLDEVNIKDNFTIESNLKFNISTEYYKQSNLDDDEVKMRNLINNLNMMDTNITLKQDKNNKELYFNISEYLDKEVLVNYKYLISNSTGYYYLDNIIDSYINDGNCNYFENLDEDNTSKSNLEYIYNFIMESFKNNLLEDYFEVYDDSSLNANKISLKLTNKEVISILKGVLSDLKKDSKANSILTGIDSDFSSYKIDSNKKYLENDQSITFNIYTTKLFNDPIKYEFIYLDGNNKKYIYYEDKTIYIIDNDSVKYQISTNIKKNKIILSINNSKDTNIGSFKLVKDNTGINLSYNFDDNTNKYDYTYNSSITYNEQDKTYTKLGTFTFRKTYNKIIKYDGTLNVTTTFSEDVKIDEDTDSQIIKSTLTDEQKNAINNKKDIVKDRLER